MGEDLDERVLDRLVGVGAVAEILIRNAEGAPLMSGHEPREPIAGFVDRPPLEQAADFDRELRVLGTGWRSRPPDALSGRHSGWPGACPPVGPTGASARRVVRSFIKKLRCGRRNRLQFTP